MESLRKGLGKFGVLSQCQTYPQTCRELFVHSEKRVLYADFQNLMVAPTNTEHREVFEWFNNYLKAREGESTGM